MTDDENVSDDVRWLLEPLESDEIRFRLRLGSEVELSPAARDAVETLLTELNEAEVTGYTNNCPGLWDNCNPLKCSLTNCQPLVSQPCAIDQDCRVTSFGRFGKLI